MKKIATLCLFCFCLFSLSQTIVGKVTYVSDGDTFYMLDEKGEKQTIRLSQIDTLERSQPYGLEAKEFVLTRILNKMVLVKTNSKNRYGRWIGEVFYNNINLNRELVEKGFAWVYLRYSKIVLIELESAAKSLKLGLWEDKNPIAPWEWRKLKAKPKVS